MAIEDINIRLKMVATGVKEQVDSSEKIADNYAMAATNAQKLGAQQARAAAFAGSRSPRETVEYGMARGAAGATGASARDFANQAQGLGGLVRLYATYAANIFAVSAAFRALSDAMNTANMVRGLDQLGAASGRALGNLSKQLVDATDGAISLRDSMVAVAQTSAAGMSSQNILRLGAAAQKASQALGVNMADALNRLSRGITKLEPELLDELGVFIRIDDAAEKYARTLGKTVGSLTEFERRQGFALAVLEQVEDKFSKIKLETNPYDKLAASLDNLTKKVLDFVNIGLGPVVNFLAQSQAALGAALLGLGTIVLRQALPVLTQYREGLKKTREASLAMAAETSGALAKQQIDNMKKALKAFEEIEDRKIDAADAAQKKYETLQKKYAQDERKTFDARIKSILAKQATDVTSEDLAYIDKKAAQTEKANKKMAASYREVSSVLNEAKIAALATEQARQDKAAAEADYEKKYGNNLQKNLDLRQQLTKAARDDIAVKTATAVKDQGYFSALKTGFSQVLQQRKELAVDIPILGDAGKKTGQTSKLVVGGLGAMETALAGVRVAASATGQLFAGLLSRLGTIGIVVSVATAVFQVFNSILSDSEKQAEAFRKSQDLLAGSIKNVGDTLEAIRNKKPEQILSIESIQARANAFNDLSDAIIKTSTDFDKLIAAQNGWNQGLDATARFFGKTLGEWGKNLAEGPLTGVTQIIGGLAVVTSKASEALFGKGAQAEFSDRFAESIAKSLAVAESEVQRSELAKSLREILGEDIDLNNLEKLKEAINKLGIDELRTKSEQASKAIKKISDEANNSASILTSLKESIKTVSKEVDGLNTSLIPTDRLSKIGIGFIESSNNLLKALDDTNNSLVAIKEVTDSMQVMSLLPPDTARSLIQDKNEIAAVTKELGIAREALRGYKEELATNTGDTDKSRQRRTELKSLMQDREAEIESLDRRAAAITDKYGVRLQTILFDVGVRKLEDGLKRGLQQASISAAKGYLGVLSQLGVDTSAAENKLAQQQLNIQKELINSQYESRLALERNTNALENSTTQKDIETIKDRAAVRGGYLGDEEDRLNKLEAKRDVIAAKEEILNNSAQLNLKNLNKLRQTGTDAQKRAILELGGLMATMYGKQVAMAGILSEEETLRYKEILDKERSKAKLQTDDLKLEIDRYDILAEELKLRKEANGVFDALLEIETESNERARQGLRYEIQRINLQADIEAISQVRGKNGEAEEERLERLKNMTKELKNLDAKRLAESERALIKLSFDRIKGLEGIRQKEYENAAAQLKANDEISNARLDAQIQYLQLLDQVGAIDKIGLTQEQTRITLIKEEQQLQQQLLDIANRQKAVDADRAAMVMMITNNIEVSDEKLRSVEREQELLNAQRDSILAGNEARKESIRLQAEQNIKLEQQNYLLQQGNKVSNILNNDIKLFGPTFSQGLAGAIETLGNVKKSIDAGKTAQEAWNKRAEEYGEFPPPAFIEEGVRLQKKAAEDELDRNAQVLGSTKKLFKEKTAAYKTFGALEKAYHIARLIMSAKEIATTIAQTVSFVTSSITRQGIAATEAGVLGAKAVINAMSTLPPPFSFAAGAAMTAAVAAVLAAIGKSFKGNSKAGFVATTQQDQEVQGTAMSYNSEGAKVQTSRGVFGDVNTKSDPIGKSIANLEKNSVEGLQYDNSILQTLQSIDLSVGDSSNSLYKLLGQNANFRGFIQGGVRADKVLGIFTPKTVTTEIQKAGLIFTGSLNSLTNDIQQNLKSFQSGTQTTKTAWYNFWDKEGTTAFSNTFALGANTAEIQLLQDFRNTFKGLRGLITEVGTIAGKSAEQIQAALDKNIGQLTLNIKDLPLEEQRKQLNGILGVILDVASSDLFSQYEQFAKNNEELLTTVIRVITETKRVNQLLANLGGGLVTLPTGIDADKFVQDLLDIAGGIEKFIAKVEFFREKFLTEEERLTATREELTGLLSGNREGLYKQLGLTKEQFQKLNLAVIDSREEYKQFIQTLQQVPVTKENSESVAKLLNAMLDLGPAFDKVYASVEQLSSKLKQELFSLTNTLKPLETAIKDILIEADNFYTELKAQAKDGIVSKTDLTVLAEFTRQKMLAAIKKEYETLYSKRKQELTDTISTIKQLRDTITNFKSSLLVGSLSTLTPMEKYSKLLGEYTQTLADVNSSDKTIANTAAQKFPEIAQQLLTSGSELFASSAPYQALFDQVTRDTDMVEGKLGDQLTTAELELQELIAQGTTLGLIEDNTANTKTTLDNLFTLFTTISNKPVDTIVSDLQASKAGTFIESIVQALGLNNISTDITATFSTTSAQFSALLQQFLTTANEAYKDALQKMVDANGSAMGTIVTNNQTILSSIGVTTNNATGQITGNTNNLINNTIPTLVTTTLNTMVSVSNTAVDDLNTGITNLTGATDQVTTTIGNNNSGLIGALTLLGGAIGAAYLLLGNSNDDGTAAEIVDKSYLLNVIDTSSETYLDALDQAMLKLPGDTSAAVADNKIIAQDTDLTALKEDLSLVFDGWFDSIADNNAGGNNAGGNNVGDNNVITGNNAGNNNTGGNNTGGGTGTVTGDAAILEAYTGTNNTGNNNTGNNNTGTVTGDAAILEAYTGTNNTGNNNTVVETGAVTGDIVLNSGSTVQAIIDGQTGNDIIRTVVDESIGGVVATGSLGNGNILETIVADINSTTTDLVAVSNALDQIAGIDLTVGSALELTAKSGDGVTAANNGLTSSTGALNIAAQDATAANNVLAGSTRSLSTAVEEATDSLDKFVGDDYSGVDLSSTTGVQITDHSNPNIVDLSNTTGASLIDNAASLATLTVLDRANTATTVTDALGLTSITNTINTVTEGVITFIDTVQSTLNQSVSDILSTSVGNADNNWNLSGISTTPSTGFNIDSVYSNLSAGSLSTSGSSFDFSNLTNPGYSYYSAPAVDMYSWSDFWDWSDARLKKNIEFVKTLPNGINLYDFNYRQPLDKIYGTGTKRGVLAQDVQHKYPDAVIKTKAGFTLVDYSQLPVDPNQIDFRAMGGPVSGNSPYIVGEVGPELFVPKTNGYIVPNNKLEFRENGGPVNAGQPYIVGEAGKELFVPNDQVNYYTDEVLAGYLRGQYFMPPKLDSTTDQINKLLEQYVGSDYASKVEAAFVDQLKDKPLHESAAIIASLPQSFDYFNRDDALANLPSDWYRYTGKQKVDYFNANGITAADLRNMGQTTEAIRAAISLGLESEIDPEDVQFNKRWKRVQRNPVVTSEQITEFFEEYLLRKPSAEEISARVALNLTPNQELTNLRNSVEHKEKFNISKDPSALLASFRAMPGDRAFETAKAIFNYVNVAASKDKHYITDKQLSKVLGITEQQLQGLRAVTGAGPAPKVPLTYRDRDIITLAKSIKDRIAPTSNTQQDILLAIHLSKMLNEKSITDLSDIERRDIAYDVEVGRIPVFFQALDEYGYTGNWAKMSVNENAEFLTPAEIAMIKKGTDYDSYEYNYLPIIGKAYRSALINKKTGEELPEIVGDDKYGTKILLENGGIKKTFNQHTKFVRELLDRMDWKNSSGTAWDAYGKDADGYPAASHEMLASVLNRLPAGEPIYTSEGYWDDFGSYWSVPGKPTGQYKPNKRGTLQSLAEITASDVPPGRMTTLYGGEGKTHFNLNGYNDKGPMFSTVGASTGFKAFWESLGPVGQALAMVALAYVAGPLIGAQAGAGSSAFAVAGVEGAVSQAVLASEIGAAVTGATGLTASLIDAGLSPTVASVGANTVVKGTLQGLIAEELGGDFVQGFAGAAVGAMTPVAISQLTGVVQDSLNLGPALSKGLATAIVSGAISETKGGDFFTSFLASGLSTAGATAFDYAGQQIGVDIPNVVNRVAGQAVASALMGTPFDISQVLQNIATGEVAKQVVGTIVETGKNLVRETPEVVSKGGTFVPLQERAMGGPVLSNTPYLVGEVGPELFVPSTNGTIVPNNELSFNNQEIVAKLDQLIQAVAKGAVLNVQATKENTECIEQAIVSNTNMVRTQSRVGIK